MLLICLLPLPAHATEESSNSSECRDLIANAASAKQADQPRRFRLMTLFERYFSEEFCGEELPSDFEEFAYLSVNPKENTITEEDRPSLEWIEIPLPSKMIPEGVEPGDRFEIEVAVDAQGEWIFWSTDPISGQNADLMPRVPLDARIQKAPPRPPPPYYWPEDWDDPKQVERYHREAGAFYRRTSSHGSDSSSESP